MKQVSTKKALIASVLSMLVCVSMLIGSTFAWFTDSASTNVNVIKAGNLKVELIKGDTDEALSESLKWVKASGHEDEAVLWEPGATYELESFRIRNGGNLAIKYKIAITGLTGSAKLLEAIDFTVTVEGDETVNTITALDGYEGKLSADSNTGKITISGHMREDAGNEYMDKEISGISIAVYATQATEEYDSNGNTYDENATYPAEAIVPVKTKTEEGVTKVAEDVTIKSAATVSETPDEPIATATVPADTKLESADVASLKLVIVETDEPDGFTVEGDAKVATYDVSVEGVHAENETAIIVKLYVGKNLENVKLYHNGVEMTVADYSYDAASGYITFKTATFSPFTITYSKSWSKAAAEDYATAIDETNKVVTIASAEELALLAKQVNAGTSYKGYTVKLVADIDLDKNKWEPIGKSGKPFQGIFDGQNHKISNLVVGGKYQSDVGLFGLTQNGEVKNFTLENADVTGYLDVGAVAGTPYTSKYTNIKLIGNVKINGYAYVGGMLGKNAYANLTDLTINVNEGSYVKADSGNYRTYVGGLVGFMGEGKQVVKNVTSNIDVIGSTCDVGGITGIAHYGNTFTNCHSSGNVTLVSAPDAGDELEIGGIAGVWHDLTGYTVTIKDCTFTGKLSSNNAVTGAVTAFENGGLVGRRYGSGNGTLIIE